MNRSNEKLNTAEKERIRSEIDAQIEAFLRAGGKIDVLHTHRSGKQEMRGSVWHGPDDIPGLSQ